MSTHKTNCVVCGQDCYCPNDAHALGCGGVRGEGGCENPPMIEFCSLACAEDLTKRLERAIANYHVVMSFRG